jgi:hypothetical protein
VRIWRAFVLLGGVLAFLPAEPLFAQGTAFTYQGRLNDGSAPANGSYDLTFSLFNTNTTGTPLAGPVTNAAVSISNGLFTVMIDFGSSVWNGRTNWLEVGVRTNGASGFTTLAPRQQVTPTPYAITAANVSGVIPSANLSGTYGNQVVFTNANNNFSGIGSNLTLLNASQLASGTVADARLSPNVALLNGNQTFSGANAFTNFGNSFRGSFFGNGLVGWIPTNGAAVQAAIDTGYLLTNSQLVTVTLPATANPGDIVRISGAGAGGWLVKENSGQSILGNFASYGKSYPVGPPYTGYNYYDVAASVDGIRMYAVGNGITGVQASSDSGQTWSQAGLLSPSCQSVACSANGRIVYAVTITGVIWMSTNSGAVWSSVTGSATTISCTADGSQYFPNTVCSGNGTYRAQFTSSSISVSTNAGTSFSVSIPPPSANLSCLAVSSDCRRFVAGVNNGLLYGSANSGATWTPITTTNQVWSGAWMSEDGSKFAATVSNNGSTVGGVYPFGVSVLPGTISTNSTISGSQSTAVELQCIGNNQWMPVSSTGTIWAY